jgi:hypothetical protein
MAAGNRVMPLTSSAQNAGLERRGSASSHVRWAETEHNTPADFRPAVQCCNNAT